MRSFCPSASSQKGFTLIETMVVVAIMAVLTALAAPSFQDALDRYRSTAAYDELRATFAFARSEAIRRRLGVIVERSPMPAVCATIQEWQCGWIVYPDIDANNVRNPDGSEPIIRQIDPLPGGTVININKANQNRINFDRWGNITPLGAFSMTIVPRGEINSQGVKTLCSSAGGRFRPVDGDVTIAACANQ